MLTDIQITRLQAIKTALIAAEHAHPRSPNLRELHARMAEAVHEGRNLMTDDQFQALGGGTPKTSDPVPGE